MVKKLCTILFLLLPLGAIAQQGTPYITSFRSGGVQDLQNWSVCQDDRGVTYFANRKGLISFDGYRWERINLPSTPVVISRDKISNRIYVGTRNGFGFLERDSRGIVNYYSISSDTTELGIISGICFEPDRIIFHGEKSVSEYMRESRTISRQWVATDFSIYSGAFFLNDKLFINVAGRGLHRIDSDTLFPVVSGYVTEGVDILFTLPHSSGRLLAGMSNNKLSLFDGIKSYEYPFGNQEYLDENILSSGIEIGNERYAFATLYGGVVVTDRFTGEILYTINYENGLPDDEVYALGSDINDGLWITHGMGISRVDLSLPVTGFSAFPGLEGVPVTSAVVGDKLYVATNTGLFMLDEVKSYSEIEEYYPVRSLVEESTPVEESEATEKPTTEQPGVKRVLSRLFGKRSGQEQATAEAEGTADEPAKTETRTREVVTYQKRKVSRLESVNWMYRRVEGINTRCTALLPDRSGLVVVAGSGLFMVNGLEARSLMPERSVNSAIIDGNNLFTGTDSGITLLRRTGSGWEVADDAIDHTRPVYSLVTDSHGNLWAGGINSVFRFTETDDNRFRETGWYYYDSEFQENCMISAINDTIHLFAEAGVFTLDPEADLYSLSESLSAGQARNGKSYLFTQGGKAWLFSGGAWRPAAGWPEGAFSVESYMRLFDDLTSITGDSQGRYWVIDATQGIFCLDPNPQGDPGRVFRLYVKQVSNEDGIILDLQNLVLSQGDVISIDLSAPNYLKETSTLYSYFIEGRMKNWTPWSTNPRIDLFLESGDYTMHFRARSILGEETGEHTIRVTIKPPFTKSAWFYMLAGLAATALLLFIMDLRQRKLRHDKRVLEEKVRQRTAEIELRKKQIEEQRDEILSQKEEITSSITYARRIQEAILPDSSILRESFAEHFVIYKPRDIVSGDFYWIAGGKRLTYFAVADCTGHGVPGAIMSMLGISLLNEITGEGSLDLDPAAVLNTLRDKIVSSLHRASKDEQASDGMDIALLRYDKSSRELQYAGAYNPVYHFRKQALTIFKADRMPIGAFHEYRPFTNQSISIKKGDTVYLFSDGYHDQFGGPRGKRFTSRNLRITISGITDLPMEKQAQFLEQRFDEWRGDNDQVDDIIVTGLRF